MDLTQTQTQVLKVSDLRPNAGELECIGVHANPRQISETDYAKLLTSMKAKNMTGVLPLKVFNHEGTWYVLGGNMRLRAMQELGIEQVSCIVVPADTDAETLNEIIIKDNATFGEWDMDALANWDEPLADWGVDVPNVGLQEPEEAKDVQEDDFDEEKDKVETVCKKGDIWLLGQHRLMCGDSTMPEDFAALMDGNRADIAFTSPPYNAGSINIESNPRTHAKYGEYDDNKSSEDYLQFISTNVGLLLQHSEEIFYNIGLVSGNKKEIFKLINAYIDNFKDMIYWKKSNCAPMIQPGVINNLVEFIIAFGNNGTRKFKNPQFTQGSYYNVIEGKNASDNEYANIHKAVFPVYLPSEFIKTFTPNGGSVLDCFGGTGTTMIAAEQLGRKCYMMELDPHYCDVIIARWEKLTGQKATRLCLKK